MGLPATVDALLALTNSQKTYLLELSPYNIVDDTVDTFYLSNDAYATEPTDTPANTQFLPVLDSIPSFNRRIENVLFGNSRIDLGTIVVPDDGRFADWLDRSKYIWGGYSFRLLVGANYFPYSDFEEVITGVMLDIEYSITNTNRSIDIRVGSNDVFLQQKTLSENTYTSPPNTALEDKVIPVAYGFCQNIRPDIYDTSNLIFQFNDGSIGESEDVVMVYDQNVEVVLGGTASAGAASAITLAGSASSTDDEYIGCEIIIVAGTGIGQVRTISDYVGTTKVATVSTAWDTNPDATSVYTLNLFIKDLVEGRFTLLEAPTSVSNITADIKGLKDSGGTYLQTIADIIQHILINSGSLSVGDLDADSFNNFPNTDYVQSYFNSALKVEAALSNLLLSAGAAGGRTRLGKYQLIRLDAPPSSGEDIELTEVQIFSIKRTSYKAPVTSIILGYAQNYTTNAKGIEDNNATDERKEFISEEYRRIEATASGAAAIYKLAEEPVVEETVFSTQSGALAEANRRAGIYKYPSDIYTIECTANPFKQSLGGVVKVTYPAYDLSNGAYMRIIGINPNITEGTKIRLTLWRLHD